VSQEIKVLTMNIVIKAKDVSLKKKKVK